MIYEGYNIGGGQRKNFGFDEELKAGFPGNLPISRREDIRSPRQHPDLFSTRQGPSQLDIRQRAEWVLSDLRRLPC